MRKVEVYSRENCSYCVDAKKLLDLKGIPYEEVDATTSEYFKSQGFRSVPQIFIDDRHVGGFEELVKELM